LKVGDDLELRGVSIRLRATGAVLVERLDLRVGPGDVATVMGPSGSGKSSLLAYLAGFLDRRAFAATGEVRIGPERLDRLPPERRHLGLLFQDPLLFPHLSVGGNLLYGLPRDKARKRREREGIVAGALARAGLSDFAGRDPATLSGGQRARVALLRTLLAEPRALLLDEPFGALDAALRDDFRRFVFGHARERGLPAILVTHDEADAAAAGGLVVRLGGASSDRAH
jgi:putative thiamine transport system ATP-binding protein